MADYILEAHVPGAQSRYIASKTGLKYWSRGAQSRYIACETGLKYWSRDITYVLLEFKFENPTKIRHLFIVRRTYGKLRTINLSQAQRQQIKLLTPKRQIEAKHVNMSFDVSHQ